MFPIVFRDHARQNVASCMVYTIERFYVRSFNLILHLIPITLTRYCIMYGLYYR